MNRLLLALLLVCCVGCGPRTTEVQRAAARLRATIQHFDYHRYAAERDVLLAELMLVEPKLSGERRRTAALVRTGVNYFDNRLPLLRIQYGDRYLITPDFQQELELLDWSLNEASRL